MRPEEIDYSDTRKHYFDLSNGEVLAGTAERDRYIKAGAQAVHVVELGDLLRDPTPHIDPQTAPYPKVDTSEWPRERFADFTRWLSRVVSPPNASHERRVNTTVLWHARQLGMGPGVHAIKKEFGSYTNLYQEAHIGKVHTVGLFDEWGVDDAVAYIKRVGSKVGDRRPTVADLKKRNDSSPNNPQAGYLSERFGSIGGFRKLLELAGYPVVQHWDRDDYLAWGVRFMRANDGQVPSQSMIDYLSKKDRGPSASIVAKHFDYLSSFQTEVIRRFYAHKQEIEKRDQGQLERIKTDLSEGAVPLELFSPFPHEPGASEEEAEDLRQALEGLYSNETLDSITDQLGVYETIVRYAKFKVLEEVAPRTGMKTKFAISRGLTEGSFGAAIRKVNPMPLGDIEYAALVEDVFDYIWLDDAQVEPLVLDDGYKEYTDSQSLKSKHRYHSKKKVAIRA